MTNPLRALLTTAALASSLLAAPRAFGQSSLHLEVIDAESGAPLHNALVRLEEAELASLSDADGIARIEAIPAGSFTLRVERIGFAPVVALVRFEDGDRGEGRIELTANPVVLGEVRVEAPRIVNRYLDRRGYYHRERRGLGRFFDRTALEEINPATLSDVFRPLPFVHLVPVEWADNILVCRRSGSRQKMAIFLDGVPWSGSIDRIPVSWIAGMEVYTGPAQVPVEYNATQNGCGVVLIWTG